MQKNIVFFVHGIGQHATGWSRAADGPIVALNNAMKLYPNCFPAGKNLEDYLELVEIRYDDIFDKVLDTWQDLGKSIPMNSGFNWVDSMRDLFTSVNGNKELFLRYGGDVLLYCGFDLVARAVRLRVNSVIATKIYQAHLAAASTPGQLPLMSVIAHSLGTTVAQDALYQLANAKWDDDIAAVSAQRPELNITSHLNKSDQKDYQAVIEGAKQNPDKPIPVDLDTLFLVANTVPLLKRTGEYALQRTASGGFDCGSVYNVNHLWDPVSKICGGLAIDNPRNHWSWSNIKIGHVHDANIHGYGHYLSNPAVHGLIFSKLMESTFTDTCYDSAQAIAQQAAWQGFGGQLSSLEEQARKKLEEQMSSISTGIGSGIEKLRNAVEAMAKLKAGV
jgi:hypothetical protein